MINKIIRWLMGYITVLVSGDNISRFLTICAMRNIDFYCIKANDKDDNKIYVTMRAREYFRLHEVVSKCKIRVKIAHKTGLPFIMHRYKKRKMMILGIGTSFAIMFVLSLFVWQIEVEGNFSHSDEEVIDFLYLNGVYHGIKIANVDGEALEKKIRNEYSDVTWVSVELQGTRLVVHVKENFNVEKDSVVEDYSDFISPYDGIIKGIITRKGTPLVKSGDLVHAGDILIRASYDILSDSKEVVGVKNVNPDGTVCMYVTYEYSDELELVINKKKYNKEHKAYSLSFLSKEFDLSIRTNEQNEDRIYQKTQLKLSNNFYLPISFVSCISKEYSIYEYRLTNEEAVTILNERFKHFLENLGEKSIQIVENNVKIDFNENKCIAEGNIVLLKEFDNQK